MSDQAPNQPAVHTHIQIKKEYCCLSKWAFRVCKYVRVYNYQRFLALESAMPWNQSFEVDTCYMPYTAIACNAYSTTKSTLHLLKTLTL